MGIQSIQELIGELVHSYYDARNVEATLRCVTDDVQWVGTESGEYANGKEELRELLMRDVEAFSEPFQVEVGEPVVQMIGESAAILTVMAHQVAIQNVICGLALRATLCCENINGEGWLVRTVHLSVPNAELEKYSLEQELDDTRKKEQILMSSIPGGIAIYRLKKDGRLETEYISVGFAKQLGYADAGEMLERVRFNALTEIPSDDVDGLVERVAASLRKDAPICATFRVFTKDHETKNVRMDANAISGTHLGDDDVAVIYAVHALVSDEEKNIVEEQKRYRNVFKMLGVAYWEWSAENGYFGSEKYNDYAISEASVCQPMDLSEYAKYVHPDDIPLSDGYMKVEAYGEQLKSVVMRAKMKDGTYRWTEIFSLTDVDSEGNLNRIISVMRDVDKEWSKQKKQREKLLEQTRRDTLTGLYNKETFESMVTEELMKDKDGDHAVVFVDLDHFKNLNDTLGHMTGDRAICDVADKLRIIFSNYDIISRFGGDEFCIFVRNIPRETLRGKMDWLTDKMHGVYSEGGKSVSVSCSSGIAFTSDAGYDYKDLMHCADRALYIAKKTGRNRYTFHPGGQCPRTNTH